MTEDLSEMTRDELERYIKQLEKQADFDPLITRRKVIKAGGIAAGVGLAGIYATENVKGAPSGVWPQDGDPPAKRIRTSTIEFEPRTSDPTSPTGGSRWVVE